MKGPKIKLCVGTDCAIYFSITVTCKIFFTSNLKDFFKGKKIENRESTSLFAENEAKLRLNLPSSDVFL